MSIRLYRRRLAILNRIIRLWLRPHLADQGGSVENIKGGVVLGNYSSWLDHLLLAGTVGYELAQQEQPFRIAINNRHSHHWSSRLTRFFAPTCEYDPGKSDADANQKLTALLEAGEETVLMLPETRPTNTGALLPVADVLGNMLAQTNPTLYPLYIHGSLHAPFTACKPRQFKRHLLPNISISLFPSVRLALKDDSKRRERTRIVAGQVYDLLSGMAYAQFDHQRTVFETLLDTAKQQGMNHVIAEDVERRPLSYRKVITGAYALGSVLAKHIHRKQEPVAGLLMPNVSAGLLALLGLQAYGIAPAILNFTAGRSNMLHACKVAKVQTVVTSRRFIKMAELEDAVNAMKQAGIRILLLEELKNEITLPLKLKAVWRSFRGARAYEALHERQPSAFDADRPAVILFTSGSEGKPKGVALTHANLLSNMLQGQQRIKESGEGWQELVISPLPLYHIYAFTIAQAVLISGGHSVLIPNPRDIDGFVKELGQWKPSTFIGLNTLFVALCNKESFQALDFSSLKITISGGMALTHAAADVWKETTQCTIIEGYGLTETSPAVCMNEPASVQIGSIGCPMIHTDVRIIQDGEEQPVDAPGELCVKGPQVMRGYWQREAETRECFTPDGYFMTGDIAVRQADGYFRIVDRAKDMIIVSGFNVYPNEVEDVVSSHPEVIECAAVGVEDDASGEAVKLFVVAKTQDLTREEIRDWCKERLTRYKVPKYVEFADDLPKSNVGKILRRMLKEPMPTLDDLDKVS